MTTSWENIPFTSPRFQPLHTPSDPRPSPSGDTLQLKTKPKSDWWRVPFPAPGRDSHDGGAMVIRRKVGEKGFEARCELELDWNVKYVWTFTSLCSRAQRSVMRSGSALRHLIASRLRDVHSGDQAQLLFYLSPTEWVKTGLEFDNDEIWQGVVVCNPFSDWSIQKPHPTSSRFTISYDPSTTTLRIYLGAAGDTDGTSDYMIREVKSFGLLSAGYSKEGFDPIANVSPAGEGSAGASGGPAERLKDLEVMVGVMACSPLGGGAECVFRRFEVREGVRLSE